MCEVGRGPTEYMTQIIVTISNMLPILFWQIDVVYGDSVREKQDVGRRQTAN